MSRITLPGYGQGFARQPGEGEPVSLRTDLRGYWDATLGNTGATYYDQGVFRNNAVPMGGAGWITGHRGHTFKFVRATSSYADVGQQPELDIRTHWTIASRLRLPINPTLAEGGHVSCLTIPGTGLWSVNVLNTRRIRVSQWETGVGLTQNTSASALAVGPWYSICGLWDGGALRVFIDGIIDGSRACTGVPLGPQQDLCFGSAPGGTYCGDQEIEYVAIWARDLVWSEIVDLHCDPTLLSRELEL